MAQTTPLDADHEKQLRLRAMDIVQCLPSDPAEAERILAYAHELLANFVCGKGPSPCIGCEKMMLQPERQTGIRLAFSASCPAPAPMLSVLRPRQSSDAAPD